MSALVEVDALTHRYGDGEPVLRDLSLKVDAGESLAVVGPSGSGKSSLLHTIGALLEPTSGDVRIDGQSLRGLDADALAALRNREIGFVFQAHHLLPQCSALENVLVPTLVHPDDAVRAHAPERGRELLEFVGLGERVEHAPSAMSGGECQRVAVVRALINKPRILLADEPTGSLDAAGTDKMADVLCGVLEREGIALITVTHSDRLAARMQRVLELRDGALVG